MTSRWAKKVNTLQEFVQDLKEHEKNTRTRYVYYYGKKSFSDENITVKEAQSVEWDVDIPYWHIGSRVYLCRQGKDINKYQKNKYAQERDAKASEEVQVRYKKSSVTKKVDCPAKVTVSRIYSFQNYKLTELSKRQKQRTANQIKAAIKDGTLIAGEELYVYNLPGIEEHKNHIVGQIAAIVKGTDPKILHKVKAFNYFEFLASMDVAPEPEFVAKPWCVLLLNEDHQSMIHKWFISEKSTCQYHIIVSDGQNMWEEELLECDVENRNKKLNPCMEVPVGVLLDHLSSLLAENPSVKWNVEDKKEKSFKLTCETEVQGFPFIWQFHLKEASAGMIALHLTLPFISMVAAQEKHQKELCKLIAKKDAEIQDYRLSGATVSRKHLETKPFDEESFLKDICTKETIAPVLENPLESACTTHLKELYKAVTEAQQLLSRREAQDPLEANTEDRENKTVDEVKEDQEESIQLKRKMVSDPEMNRRLELERRLAQEEQQIAAKRKKKTIKL